MNAAPALQPAEKRPSKRQRELLSFIEAFIKSYGYGPSYREVMRALSYKSVSTVAVHIDNLIKKGHLRKRTRSARSLEVVQADATDLTVNVPVTRSQEKWLVDKVTKKFDAAEKAPSLSQKDVDDLYVLVGALQVLGLDAAATSFKPRLMALVKL